MNETYQVITAVFVMGMIAFAMNEIILRWDKRREERKGRSRDA